MLNNYLVEKFNHAFRASTPLVSINCFDMEVTMQSISENLKTPDMTAVIQWDCVNGYRPRNNKGVEAINAALGGESVEMTINPIEALQTAQKLPENTILFILNGHLFFKDNPSFLQAFWNLRDTFKSVKKMCVILSNQFILPTEIQQDVLILNEKLPTEDELRNLLKEMCTEFSDDHGIKISDEDIAAGVTALKGLSFFPAEQSIALSLKKTGLDIEELWARKIQLINDTPGLAVWKDGQKFDDLGGLPEIKSRFRRIIKGRKSPSVIIWIDEIEKSMAGTQGDSSGTSHDQLGVLLSEMVEKDYTGSILVGVPGAAKSAMAKAMGSEAEILTIKLDLGAMKGQFVGLSEERIRNAMKIIEAVGGIGGAFFIATSNDISSIKPELKRRFTKGIWFFDLPTREEREIIWSIYLKKYELGKSHKVSDEGWTGAEIENCCKMAWEENISVEEASKSIIPVSVSGKAQVDSLREDANGKYASTNYPGVYNASTRDIQMVPSKRKIQDL